MKSSQIYKALVQAISTATTAHNINAPVLADDLSEMPVYPSIKIMIDDESKSKNTYHLDFCSFTCRIYYFPPDRHSYRDAHFAMKDALTEFLADTLWIDNFDVDAADGINFSRTDEVLIAELNYEWYEPNQNYKNIGEEIESLNMNM